MNKDLIAVCERHPKRGETVRGLGLLRVPGGKGANQSLAAKKAGAEVTLVGAVGDDDDGAELLSYLQERQIDTSHVRVDAVPTGTASIFVDLNGEISIVAFPGANEKVVDDPGVKLTNGDICISQLEVPLSSIESFFIRGRQSGCTNVLNASPFIFIPDGLTDLVDILVVNEHELTTLAGGQLSDLHTPIDIATMAQRLPFAIEGTVLVLLANNDVISASRDGIRTFEGKHVRAVDYTGVEDCFIGSLAAMLVESYSVDDAITYAGRAAALASIQRGAEGPARQEVEGTTLDHLGTSTLPR